MRKSEKKRVGRQSLLRGASVLAAAAAAMAGTPAMAQDAEEEEAIVVTGTRLVRQDFESISPITTVGAEQIELTATLTTDSLLNELPQIIRVIPARRTMPAAKILPRSTFAASVRVARWCSSTANVSRPHPRQARSISTPFQPR
ncbi:MAG: hypothetical protein IPG56_20720 [Caulobacteraceae bacterium]|nr:hypothetical protein [Caulobacteraceae bacterium]